MNIPIIRTLWFNQEETMVYPLVNCHITMERSTIFHGKIHYFYGHVQVRFMPERCASKTCKKHHEKSGSQQQKAFQCFQQGRYRAIFTMT